MNIGSWYGKNGQCAFTVWSPFANTVSLKIVSPCEKIVPMEKDVWGYWKAVVEGTREMPSYFYRINDEKDRPDPASHHQPEGVHGPSRVINHAFDWEDGGWKGITLAEMIIYELHVGTFTPEGTFDAIIPRLSELKDIGINTLEIMPVAQFPGERNWGYDGVYLYAVQHSYGGTDGFKRLVNACHKNGMAVILDVVYNHLGPEGNYLADFGPYFTNRYKTPWGDAINFDGPYSNPVRQFFINNALYWFAEYHVDALRLDAIHGIYDFGAHHFLQELGEAVRNQAAQSGRSLFLFPESDLNDSKIVTPTIHGGYGLDAQWCDDFHHSLHTLLTGENRGYYQDFGKIEHIAKAVREGFVYSGGYSAFRRRNHGNPSKNLSAEQMVVFSQNHDQIGNRMLGERLSALVSLEAIKLAAGAVLLSPYIPLLFMGEEYGEDAPFLYFVSHSDHALIDAVRQGRKREFGEFQWQGEPPDPQGVETFQKSKIRWEKRREGVHGKLLAFYKHLITLRKTIPALSHLNKTCLAVDGFEEEKMVCVRRWKDAGQVCAIFNFNNVGVEIIPPIPDGHWNKIADSADTSWHGPGSPAADRLSSGGKTMVAGCSFVVYKMKLYHFDMPC